MPQILLRGRPLGCFKGVLFDKDGTLSNSEKYLLTLSKSRINQTIILLKKEGLSEKTINKTIILMEEIYGIRKKGLSPNESIAIGSRQENLLSTATILSLTGLNWAQSIALANKIFIAADFDHYSNQNTKTIERPLFPGALDFLQKLKSKEVKCAVISNDTKKGIESFIKMNKLDHIFSSFWSADDKPSKPNPNAVHKLCKKINLKESQCMLIGDAETDIKMAIDADIKTVIGFLGGWKIQPQISFKKYLFKNWNELSIK